jgi:hypothetical protein
MDLDINSYCIYLEDGACCYPDLVMMKIDKVTKEYCSKCLFKKIPLVLKAIKLLQELEKCYNEIKDEIELTPDSEETLKILEKYDEKIKEVTNFLISLNVISRETNTSDEIKNLIMENEDGNN